MKRALIVAIGIALACFVFGTAQAAEDDWRVQLRADNGAGEFWALGLHIGVHPDAVDGIDPYDPLDPLVPFPQDQVADYGTDVSQSCRWMVGHVLDDPTHTTLTRDIYSPAAPATYPDEVKVWYLRTAALPDANDDPIRLQLFATHSSVLPPETIGGHTVYYMLVMIDNRGMAGAPANGTVWDLPIPTSASGTIPYFTVPELLPVIKLSSPTHAAMLAEGYNLRFVQSMSPDLPPWVVPEPSSLLAFGTGLVGLIGLVARRRRR